MVAPFRLVGRDSERAILGAALLEDAPVVLLGEAGVGKTTLVRASVAAAGRRLREGGALALLGFSPFLPIERALGRPVSGSPAVVAAEIVRHVGADVLFLDDLHWANRTTMELLPLIAGRVATVAAVRAGDEGTNAALEAATGAGFAVLEIDPLGQDTALEMVDGLRPELPLAARLGIVRASGGNPLYVEELCRAGDTGAALRSAVRIRLDGIAPDVLWTLALLARAERPMAVADAGPGTPAALASGLAVSPGPGTVTVRHELIGRAAIERLDAAELSEIDRRLARLATDPAEAVRHHLLAGDRSTAFARATAAVDAATGLDERATYLGLAALAADGPLADDLALDAAEALLRVDRAGEALARLSPEDRFPPRLRPRRALLAAVALRDEGRPADARDMAARGLALPGLDPASEVGLRVVLARATVSTDGAPAALGLAEHALARAQSIGAHAAAALVARGVARLLAGRDGWEQDLVAGAAEACRSGDLEAEADALRTLIFSRLRDGRPAEGIEVVKQLAARGEELGLVPWRQVARWWSVGLGWHLGRYAEAVDTAMALEAEDPAMADGFYHIQLLADLGRVDEAQVRAARFLEREPPGEFRGAQALWLAADLGVLAGRPREAHDAAVRHAESYPMAGHRPFVIVSHAWAALELGRPIPTPDGLNSLGLVEGAGPELDGIRGLAAGEPEAAAAHFATAAKAWRGRHYRGALRTRWAEAEALRRAGQVDRARSQLLDLERDVEASSADGHLPRIRRSLRLCGVRRASPRRKVADSPLTEHEREVLRLLGSGVRDREIATRLGVSRWAVTRAVESASAKLGASTRAQAIARMSG